MTAPAAQPKLPRLLGEIEQLVGLRAALQVASAAGGRRRYVPAASNLAADHWLVVAIGLENARIVADHLSAGTGGMHVLFPLGPTGKRAEQWKALQDALAAGGTNNQVAGDTGLHERTIRRHRNGHAGTARRDPRQPALFDRD